MIKNMFKKPNVLSKSNPIKISPLNNYNHAKNFGFVVLTRDEVAMACKSYPVFFAKDGKDILPIAILGLNKEDNLFIDNNGQWEHRAYVPSVIRCYPFGVANVNAGGDDKKSSLSIAYDEAFEGLNKKDGKDIFEKDGKLSKFGEETKKFIEDTYVAIEQTKQGLSLLEDLSLLKSIDVNINKGKEEYKLKGMLQIDSERMNKLKDNELLALLKSGAFNVIDAHSISMTNISLLADRV